MTFGPFARLLRYLQPAERVPHTQVSGCSLFLRFFNCLGLSMRLTNSFLFAFAVTLGILSMPGCSSQEAAVAPRTEDEIEEYKKMAYGAEEESQAEAEEDQ
jgi:hypothetical protein